MKALVLISQAAQVEAGEPNALLLNTIRALAKRILLNNKLGPVVFLAPELGKWSTVGGECVPPRLCLGGGGVIALPCTRCMRICLFADTPLPSLSISVYLSSCCVCAWQVWV